MADVTKTINSMTAPLKRRLGSIILRGIVSLVADGEPLQILQASGLADEVIDDIERMQNYGFTSVPKADAEALILAVGGSRTHNVAVAVDDRRYRLKGLASGEVAIYDDLGHKVRLTRTGIVIDGSGHDVTITNTPKVRMETADLEVTGDITDRCDEPQKRSMYGMRQHYNTHTHPGDSGGTTSQPNEAM